MPSRDPLPERVTCATILIVALGLKGVGDGTGVGDSVGGIVAVSVGITAVTFGTFITMGVAGAQPIMLINKIMVTAVATADPLLRRITKINFGEMGPSPFP